MQLTVQQIAQWLGGTIEGDANALISRLSKIEEAQIGSISFVANPKYIPFVGSTQASALVVGNELTAARPPALTFIRVADAYAAFAVLLERYQALTQQQKQGIEQPNFLSKKSLLAEVKYIGAFVYVDDDACIGDDVSLYPHVYVGKGVKVGKGTIIYAGAKIYDGCSIGERCIIHAGAVIGGDGFGFAPQPEGGYHKIPQTGNVIIEDDVEIGSNTTIDRATMGATIIRKGVKIDNLVQVAHNVEIGENTVIAAQTGISGSTIIGKNCMVGGQVGFAGHLRIADNSKFGAQCGIAASINEADKTWIGSPAIPHRQYMKSYIYFKQLPDIEARIRALEQQMQGKDRLV